jgi:hypothetical protein
MQFESGDLALFAIVSTVAYYGMSRLWRQVTDYCQDLSASVRSVSLSVNSLNLNLSDLKYSVRDISNQVADLNSTVSRVFSRLQVGQNIDNLNKAVQFVSRFCKVVPQCGGLFDQVVGTVGNFFGAHQQQEQEVPFGESPTLPPVQPTQRRASVFGSAPDFVRIIGAVPNILQQLQKANPYVQQQPAPAQPSAVPERPAVPSVEPRQQQQSAVPERPVPPSQVSPFIATSVEPDVNTRPNANNLRLPADPMAFFNTLLGRVNEMTRNLDNEHEPEASTQVPRLSAQPTETRKRSEVQQPAVPVTNDNVVNV